MPGRFAWLGLIVGLFGCDGGEEVSPGSTADGGSDSTGVADAAGDVPAEAESGVDAAGDAAAEVSPDAGPTTLWRPTGGPWERSWLSAVAVDGATWVAGGGGSVFRSTDGGATFEPWPDDLARMRSGTFGVAIAGGHVAVTNELGLWMAPVSGGSFARVLEPWIWAPSTAKSTYGRLAVTASGAWITTTAFDVENRGLLCRSTDGGATWSAVDWKGRSLFARAEGESVFLGEQTTGVLRRSLDGGKTFAAIDAGGGSVQDAVATASHLIVARGDSLVARPLAGTTWSTLASFTATPLDVPYRSLVHDGDRVVALSPISSLRTADGGATWSELKGVRLDASGPGVASGGALAVPTRRAGLQRSTDGGLSWAAHGRGLQATRLGQVLPHPSAAGTLYAVELDTQALLKSTNGGADFRLLAMPGGRAIGLSGDALLSVGYGVVLRSTDDGATYSVAHSWVGAAAPTMVVSGPIVLVNSAKGFLRSPDGGVTWTEYTSPVLDRRLAVGPAGALFLASVEDGIQRSTDGGLTWRHSTTIMSAPDDLAVGPDGTAWAFAGGRLLRSTDDGDTWTVVHTPSAAEVLPSGGTRLGFTPAGELLVSMLRTDALGRSLSTLRRRAPDGALLRYDEGLWASEIHGFALGGGTLFAATDVGVYRLTK